MSLIEWIIVCVAATPVILMLWLGVILIGYEVFRHIRKTWGR